MIPRGAHTINKGPKAMVLSREYAMICHGRVVGMARGKQPYFDDAGIPTASEGAKSNAMVRCCKDLGIASELWDPIFLGEFKATHEWTGSKFVKKAPRGSGASRYQ